MIVPTSFLYFAGSGPAAFSPRSRVSNVSIKITLEPVSIKMALLCPNPKSKPYALCHFSYGVFIVLIRKVL